MAARMRPCGPLAQEVEEDERLRQEEEARRAAEHAQLEEERRLHELGRLEELAAKEAARKAEEERQAREAAIQRKLQDIGVCCMGFRWQKRAGGYQCAGGSHWVSDSQLGL